MVQQHLWSTNNQETPTIQQVVLWQRRCLLTSPTESSTVLHFDKHCINMRQGTGGSICHAAQSSDVPALDGC